jgi:hypothetical protein
VPHLWHRFRRLDSAGAALGRLCQRERGLNYPVVAGLDPAIHLLRESIDEE